MLDASLYIAACSMRNRIRLRLRRLREPRYLVGAALGMAYFLFIFIVPRRRRRRNELPTRLASVLDRVGPSLGGLGLFVLATVAWVFPSNSHLFTFTEAEVAFLFPAPVSRRQLIVHRLIRSQFGLLFAAMVPAFLFAGAGSVSLSDRLLVGIALWPVLVAVRIYFGGVTMARAHLDAAEPRIRVVAWTPLVLMVCALVVLAFPMWNVIGDLPGQPLSASLTQAADAVGTGAAGLVLAPFRTLIRPVFDEEMASYLIGLAGALAVLAVLVVWVVLSDEVFQEAAIYRSAPAPRQERRGRRTAGPVVSSGSSRGSSWRLPLAGRPEALFFWKAGVQTLRTTSLTSLLPIVILVVYAVIGARFGMAKGLPAALAVAGVMIAGFTTIIGPGSVTTDFRGDLRHIDVLKTWPVQASALLRGEMLWPGTLLTGCAWLALLCSLLLSESAFPQVTFVRRLSVYAAAMILIPALVFAQYTIHSAAAVMFPGWVATDSDMRGFESMAQRLIMFVAIVVALAAMVGPAAVIGGIAGVAVYQLTGSVLALIPAALICVVIVGIEVILATEALGPLYDRVDLSGVERVE
jgi:putative ABC exporter